MPGKAGKIWTGSAWVPVGLGGRPGRSAYEIAVENGFVGTESEWLSNMTGAAGPQGPAGPSGSPGPAGAGIPPGGSTGQILVKNSNSDYDFVWADVPPVQGSVGLASNPYVVPDGSITGGIKTQYTDFDTGYTYNVHTFLPTDSIDTLVVNAPVVGSLFVIAGGGSGGGGGVSIAGTPGGAGSAYFNMYAFGLGSHNMWIGRGGVGVGGNTSGNPGTDTWFDSIFLKGGGGGARGGNGLTPYPGQNGGCPSLGFYGGANGTMLGGSIDGGTTYIFEAPIYCQPNGDIGPGGPNGMPLSITGTMVTYGSSGGAAPNTGSGGSPGGSAYGGSQSGADGTAIVRYRIA